MITDKDIGFFKKTALKLITKLQELSLRQGLLAPYNFLVSIHYYLYFGSFLTLDLKTGSDNIYRAADRHADMVVANSPFILVDEKGSKINRKRLERIKKTLKRTFLLNLEVDLNRLTKLELNG